MIPIETVKKFRIRSPKLLRPNHNFFLIIFGIGLLVLFTFFGFSFLITILKGWWAWLIILIIFLIAIGALGTTIGFVKNANPFRYELFYHPIEKSYFLDAYIKEAAAYRMPLYRGLYSSRLDIKTVKKAELMKLDELKELTGKIESMAEKGLLNASEGALIVKDDSKNQVKIDEKTAALMDVANTYSLTLVSESPGMIISNYMHGEMTKKIEDYFGTGDFVILYLEYGGRKSARILNPSDQKGLLKSITEKIDAR